jgi:Spy/CpxP family protein refolding chaperone
VNENLNSRWKMWLVLLTVFLLGTVTGVGLSGVYKSNANASLRESRGRERQALFEKIRGDLNLNADQSTEMQKILDETAGEFRTLRGELRPRYEELRLKARGRMRALLTVDQQKKFDTLMAEIDARRQNSDGRSH